MAKRLLLSVTCAALLTSVVITGLEAQGRGGAPAAPPMPRANAGPPDRPPVDQAAAERGRTVYSAECITCHGSTARGTDTAPSLIRSYVILTDRLGSQLGPFLKKGHSTQSGKPSASLTDGQVGDLMHFLRDMLNSTLRGSREFDVKDILTGDPKAGEAYFNGEGKCTTCHSVTGDLAAIATRIPVPVDLQQRMVFPSGRGGGRGGRAGGGGGGAAGGPPAPSRTAVTVTITATTGAPITGVLVEQDDFYVTYRDDQGVTRTLRKTPALKVVTTDPLQFHRDLLDRISDKNIHDVVAYLETLK